MTVTLELLFPHLDELIQTPADVQRLNEAILQLAVQGKLVPQDPQEEPAEELLKRIVAEKEQLAEKGLIQKPKSPPPIEENEAPFELPTCWTWVRVESICTHIVDCPHSTPEFVKDGDFFCVDTTCINQGEILFDELRRVSERTFIDRIRRLKPTAGDILFSREGSIGLTVIVPAGLKICLGQRMMMFRTSEGISSEYFRYAIVSNTFVSQWQGKLTGTAARHVNIGDLRNMLLPLPPLAEQKRIVAKVDELFAQTRALEAKLRRAQEAIVVVNRAVLHHLHHAADPATFQHAAQTLGDHFDLLYTDPRPVTDLRQTILQLAVQGKLVPQDPHDEPAGELLTRIAVEKERLVVEGEVKRSGLLSPINSDDALFELPKGWAWCRLDDLLLNIEAGQSFNAQSQPASSAEFGVLKVSAVSWGQFLPQENKALWPGTIPDQKARVAAGDMLISRANTAELVGAVVLVEQDYPNLFLSDKTLRLVLVSCELSKPFLVFALRSPWVRQFFVEQATGTSTSMRNLSQEKIRNTPIALPPLAEQRRIVAKVDELLARCAALERKLGQAQVAGRQLTASVLQGVVG